MRFRFLILFPALLFLTIAAEFVERIVAVVDDEVILSSEVELLVVQRGIQDTTDEELLKKLYNDSVDELIYEKLILVAAKRESIIVSEDEVNKYFKQRWDELISGFSSMKELEDSLKKSGYSVDAFKRRLRENVREELLKQRFIDKKFQKVTLSQSEVKEFFYTYRDSLPKLPEAVSLEIVQLELSDTISPTKQLADSVYNFLEKGMSFDSVKALFSSDKRIKFVELEAVWGLFKPEVDSVIFATPIGGLSGVFADKDGNSFIVLVKDGDDKRRDISVVQVPYEKSITEAAYARSYIDSVYNIFRRGEKVPPSLGRFKIKMYNIDSISVSALTDADKRLIEDHSPGDVIPPAVYENGVRIIKIVEKFPPRTLELDHDYEIIKQLAQAEKRKKAVIDYLNKLKSSVYIEKRQIE